MHPSWRSSALPATPSWSKRLAERAPALAGNPTSSQYAPAPSRCWLRPLIYDMDAVAATRIQGASQNVGHRRQSRKRRQAAEDEEFIDRVTAGASAPVGVIPPRSSASDSRATEPRSGSRGGTRHRGTPFAASAPILGISRSRGVCRRDPHGTAIALDVSRRQTAEEGRMGCIGLEP